MISIIEFVINWIGSLKICSLTTNVCWIVVVVVVDVCDCDKVEDISFVKGEINIVSTSGSFKLMSNSSFSVTIDVSS